MLANLPQVSGTGRPSSDETHRERPTTGRRPDPLEPAIEAINRLAQRLIPPYGRFDTDEIVSILRASVQADAAAVFLVSEDDPNKLEFKAGEGYRKDYRPYFLSGPALTCWVYNHREPVNYSYQKLKDLKKEGKIDFSDRCHSYITTGEFRNIISVPILVDDRSVGVLKIENKKGRAEDRAFPPQDLGVARVLAAVIAVAYRQERLRELWRRFNLALKRHRTVHSYLQDVTSLLARFLNAEASSVFLKRRREGGGEFLKYEAGVGYADAYQNHIYELDSESLTAYVAHAKAFLRRTEDEIKAERLPYSGACRSFIKSGSFRGLIVLPLLIEEDRCIGVLKVENKRPDTAEFDEFDFQLCKTLAEDQIVPALRKLRPQERDESRMKPTAGYTRLSRIFGESQRPKKGALRSEARKLAQEMRKDGSAIKADDCAAYLQTSRAHFYRLISPKESET